MHFLEVVICVLIHCSTTVAVRDCCSEAREPNLVGI
jgi:hypothetical protein